MIMQYTGISAHKYKEYTRIRSPESLLRWGAEAYRNKVRRTFEDNSRLINVYGITLTIRQWFALVIRQVMDKRLTYKDFTSRIGTYKKRLNQTEAIADADALLETFRSLGMENIPSQAKYLKDNPKLWDKFISSYMYRINEYQQDVKDEARDIRTEQPPHPNERWFECLLADTRLHWLFYQEYEKAVAILTAERDNYKQANLNLQKELSIVLEQKLGLEKQLADFRRTTTAREFTTTK